MFIKMIGKGSLKDKSWRRTHNRHRRDDLCCHVQPWLPVAAYVRVWKPMCIHLWHESITWAELCIWAVSAEL